jgi:hypothetical protein
MEELPPAPPLLGPGLPPALGWVCPVPLLEEHARANAPTTNKVPIFGIIDISSSLLFDPDTFYPRPVKAT